MKKFIIPLYLLIFIGTNLNSQNLIDSFYGGCKMENAKDEIITENNIYIAGSSLSYYFNETDILLLKNRLDGTNIWTKIYRIQNDDYSTSINIIPLKSDEIFLRIDKHLLKIDSAGNQIWAKTINNDELRINNMIKDSYSNLYLCGSFLDTTTYDHHPFVMKLDTAGKFIQAKYFKVQSNDIDVGEPTFSWNLVCLSDSAFILTGKRYFPNYPFIIKLDNKLTPIWAEYLDEDVSYYHFNGIATNKGSIFLTGDIELQNKSILAPYIIKLNSNGQLYWAKTYEYLSDSCFLESDSYASNIMVDEISDNELLLGCTVEKLFNDKRYLLAKLDTSGNIFWSMIYGEDSSYNVLNKIISYKDIVYVLGTSNSNYLNFSGAPFMIQNDIRLSSLDTYGNSVLISKQADLNQNSTGWQLKPMPVDTFSLDISIIPDFFESESVSPIFDSLDCAYASIKANNYKNFFSIYPNPNNGFFKIHYSGDYQSNVFITLFDVYGKKIFQIPFTFEKSDKTVDISYLHKGIYILSIQLDQEIYSKMIIKL